ncbi:MAG: SIMPL domain-containing protein [Parcubacteria group bacterium]|nr:SIMPL domain-containing protein [Parcubacteria group bacterium]
MENLKKYFDSYAGYVFWAFFVLLAAGALFVLALFYNEVKSARFVGEGIEFRNTISVSGEGEVFAAPDTAQFSFAVIEEADTVSEAQTVVTKKMNAILDALKKDMDVPEKNIKTTNYNIAPRYEYEESRTQGGFPISGERILVGYEVSHWVEVKMKNDDTIGKALARVGELGATNISSVNFVIEDEERVLRDARKKAIADAKEKAKILADDLDVKIIKIVNFSEGGGPVYYARDFAVSEAAFGKGGGAPTPEIPVGENKITSFVTIIYAIE